MLFTAVIITLPSFTFSAGLDASNLSQIKALMDQYAILKNQLVTVRGEINGLIRQGLVEGTTDDDVKEIQTLLATDPAIYPEGMTTGYYGPLTKEAIKRFQIRHNLEVSGKIDEETRLMMEEYLHEAPNGNIPPGLLKSPGIAKKVEERISVACDETPLGGTPNAMSPLCQRLTAPQNPNETTERCVGGSNSRCIPPQSMESAEKAIAEAVTSIDETSAILDGGSGEIDKAEELIMGARTILDEAKKSFNGKLYTVAETLAIKAKKQAEDAGKLIKKGQFDVQVTPARGTGGSVKTSVTFLWKDEMYTVTSNSTRPNDVYRKIATKINTSTSRLDSDLKKEVSSALTELNTEKKSATDAIQNAKDKISDVRKAIPNSTRFAEERAMLTEANGYLTKAGTEFSAGKYESAKELAQEAFDTASEIEDLI